MQTRNEKRVNELYRDLPPFELAKLMFSELVAGKEENEKEAEFLADKIPRKIYLQMDADYERGLNGLYDLATCFSLEWWPLYAKLQRFRSLADKEAKDSALMAAITRLEQALLTLEAALKELASQQGFEAATVRQFGGLPVWKAISDAKPCPDTMAALVTELEQLLKR